MEIITLTQEDSVSNVPSALSKLTCEMIISLHLPYKKKVNSVTEKMLSSAHLPFLRKTWHKYAIKIQTFRQNAAL